MQCIFHSYIYYSLCSDNKRSAADLAIHSAVAVYGVYYTVQFCVCQLKFSIFFYLFGNFYFFY